MRKAGLSAGERRMAVLKPAFGVVSGGIDAVLRFSGNSVNRTEGGNGLPGVQMYRTR
jgi:hypothetical protein